MRLVAVMTSIVLACLLADGAEARKLPIAFLESKRFSQWLTGASSGKLEALQQLLELGAASGADMDRIQRVRKAVLEHDAATLRAMLEEDLRRSAEDPEFQKRMDKLFAIDVHSLDKDSRLELIPRVRQPTSLAALIHQGQLTSKKIAFAEKVVQLDIEKFCDFQINGVKISTGILVGTEAALRRVLASPAISMQDCSVDTTHDNQVDRMLKLATPKSNIAEASRAAGSPPVTLTAHDAGEFLKVVQESGAVCNAKGKICLDSQGKAKSIVTLACKVGAAQISLATDGSLVLSAGPVSLNFTAK